MCISDRSQDSIGPVVGSEAVLNQVSHSNVKDEATKKRDSPLNCAYIRCNAAVR